VTGQASKGRDVPTYQYVCTSCETPLEVVQSFSDPSLTECPACDGGTLRKVFSAVGVVFKGSGFYRTDNRAGAKAGAGASGDAKPAAAKADAAPAAKGEPKAAGGSSSTTAKPAAAPAAKTA
jgi:putative FmdB family regulatory protein